MRVTSALWVAAFVRRVNATAEAFAVVARRGAAEAGAILVRVDQPNGMGNLFTPAPQSLYGEATDRLFIARFPAPVDKDALDQAIARETRLDPDVWVVAVDDRLGRHHLGEAVVD